MSVPSSYWFRAKRYGWGWGLPRVWQGWAVLAVFFVLAAAGAGFLLPSGAHLFFFGYMTVLCVLLVAVCWLTGEPPRWRWGE